LQPIGEEADRGQCAATASVTATISRRSSPERRSRHKLSQLRAQIEGQK
jgi:hypothetical protein